MNNDKQLLRALRLNAAFSSVSAMTLLLAAPWIVVQLGLSTRLPVYVVGGGLILFALQLWNIVRTRRIRTWEIRGIIGGDVAWVVASVVLVALFYSRLTLPGLLLVDLIALAVLYFAIQQLRGLRRLRDAV